MKNATRAAVIAAMLTAIAGAAHAASGSDTNQPTRWWLHPKLGMVRVDATTGAMPPTRPASVGQPSTGQARYWVDPKGNVRRTPKPDE